jgi:uncharacterized protein YidB (DUF937 family)
MSALDTILGAVKGGIVNNENSESTDNTLLESVISMVGDQQSGGLMGLVEKFSAGGLSEQVTSWVSTGQNLPVTSDQVQAVLGSSFVQDIATKMNIDTTNVASNLAHLLPLVIDKLTPDGEISDDNNLSQIALAGLSSLLSNKSA